MLSSDLRLDSGPPALQRDGKPYVQRSLIYEIIEMLRANNVKPITSERIGETRPGHRVQESGIHTQRLEDGAFRIYTRLHATARASRRYGLYCTEITDSVHIPTYRDVLNTTGVQLRPELGADSAVVCRARGRNPTTV